MSNTLFDHNRLISCHFDSYSTALVFARYGSTILAPAPLPESAAPADEPDGMAEHHAPSAVFEDFAQRSGLDPAKMRLDDGFEAWMSSDSGMIRVHLIRFTTLDAPAEAIEPLGGKFKPISEMRGLPMIELNLMRRIFDRIMSGG